MRCSFSIDGRHALTLFDDAMISMRYARNLVEHGELTWNVGEAHVEGYTNLLWTLCMSVVHFLPLHPLHISYAIALLGVGLLLANGRVVLAISAKLAVSPTATATAVAATLFSYGVVYWTLRGMEVGLLALLVTCAIAVLYRLTDRPSNRDLLLLLGCAVGALLTRTDSLVLIVVWIAYAAVWVAPPFRRRVAISLTLVVIVTLAAHTLFRWGYYGAPMPNTYYLKLGDIALSVRLARGAHSLMQLAQLGWSVPLAMAVFAFTSREHRPAKALLALHVGAACAYSVYVGGDAWEEFAIPNRYLCPVLPAFFLLAAMGTEAITSSRRRARAFALVLCVFAGAQLIDLYNPYALHTLPRESGTAIAACIALLVVVSLVVWRPASQWLLGAILIVASTAAAWVAWWQHNAAHVDIDVARVRHGLAIAATTAADATIATTPCGSIPYFAGRRTLDLLGKSDPHIARTLPRATRFHPGHVKWDYAYSIGAQQPDLVDELYTPPEKELVAPDLAMMPGWGYEEVTTNVYVRSASQRVDVRRLRELLDRANR